MPNNRSSSRLLVFAPDPATGELDRAQVHQALLELEAVLFRVGGKFQIAADREIVAYTAGEPVAVTRGYVVEYQSFSPARHHPGVQRPAKRENGTAPAPEPEAVEEAPEIPEGNPDELLSAEEIERLLADESQ